jgi:hypothetical protein
MGLTVFQVLDKAMEVGGTDLAGKDLVGSAKGANPVLAEMCISGLLEKTAAKSPKYTLTPKGREAWEQEASEDRRRQVKRHDQERRQQAVAQFLSVVEKKQGKALTRAELSRLPITIRQEACDHKLIEPGEKASSFRLLPAGEELLLAQRPIGDQLQRLRQQHQQMVAQWRAIQKTLGQELERAGSQKLETAGEYLAERGAAACQAFDATLADLGGLATVAEAARQLRAEVEEATRQARQVVEAEQTRLADLESRLRRESGQQREQLEAFERQLEMRLVDVARRLGEARPGVSDSRSPQPDGQPSEAALWEATRSAYERLRQETLRIGGIVKVPELTDAVMRVGNGLVPAAFHNLLQKWQQEDRLTLQLCNDPRLEPRSAEGISSPRGLLFYVQMR